MCDVIKWCERGENAGRFERVSSSNSDSNQGVLRTAALFLASLVVSYAVCASANPSEQKPSAKGKKKVVEIPSLGDVRGEPDLIICSQNLKLFGTINAMQDRSPGFSPDDYEERTSLLVRRFVSAKCDVVAVQEVMGRTQEMAKEVLDVLAKRLRRATNRQFETVAAPPAEGGMTIGYLVAKDRAEIASTVSYAKVELPKMVAKQKPRLFPRTPLELQLAVRSKQTEIAKTVTLINFHFKSKRGAQDDPTGLEWETYRMEMAEALRRIAERRHASSFASGDSLLVLLGDRNSNFDVASSRILEGSLALSSFQNEAPCRLSKRGMPLCKAGEALPQRLFSVLTLNPATKGLPGTFTYKGQYSWLDDILMPAESLPFAWETPVSEGRYASGVTYSPKDASDHALVWVGLNW